MREELGEREGLLEKRMFGGPAFLLHGNMVCGAHRGGGMFRVDKASEGEALALQGVAPIQFTGRRMGGRSRSRRRRWATTILTPS